MTQSSDTQKKPITAEEMLVKHCGNIITWKGHTAIKAMEEYAQSYYIQKLQEVGDIDDVDDVIKNNAVSEIEDGFTTDKLLIDVALIKPIIAKLKHYLIQQITAKNEWKLLSEEKIVELNRLRAEIEKKDEEITQLKQELEVERESTKLLSEATQMLKEKDKQIESLKVDVIGFANWLSYHYPSFKEYTTQAKQELYLKYLASK